MQNKILERYRKKSGSNPNEITIVLCCKTTGWGGGGYSVKMYEVSTFFICFLMPVHFVNDTLTQVKIEARD